MSVVCGPVARLRALTQHHEQVMAVCRIGVVYLQADGTAFLLS